MVDYRIRGVKYEMNKYRIPGVKHDRPKDPKMYKFKPFVFMKHAVLSKERPKRRSGHRIVCDDKNIYSYGGFNPCISETDPDMQDDDTWMASKPLFKEIWKYNLATQRWKRLQGQDTMPNELASCAVIPRGNSLLVYGGTGVPFGSTCSNQLYKCDLTDGRMQLIPAKGDMPEPQYGQALVCHGPYLYTVGGTTGVDFNSDIHRFDLRTCTWETVYICSGVDQNEPVGRYRHELAFDGKRIYVLGGGTAEDSYGFSEIPAFDLQSNRWVTLPTRGDDQENLVPTARRSHGSVQYTDERTGATLVVISGGYNIDQAFSDVWRLDLSTLQWTRLRKCILPSPIYFHSAAIMPDKRMCIFGGVIKDQRAIDEVSRTNKVYSVWLTIPKLSDICWEALLFYYPQFRRKLPQELLHLGIPMKFLEKMDFVNC